METLSASCIISSKNSLGSSSDSESTVPYLGYQTSTFHGLRSMKSVDKLQLWTTANAYCRKARRRSSQNVISNPFSTIICQNRMRIVFIAAECAPWSKTGGLGDVIGALPPALVEIGHRVMTVTPRYDQYRDVWDTNVLVELKVGDKTDTVRFFHCYRHGVDRVFIDHPLFLEKVCGKTGGKLYGPIAGEDFDDNQLRFSILCQAAIEATRVLSLNNGEDYSGEYGEDVVFVCNDWHTALLPCYLKSLYKENGIYKNAKVVFCIHNISYQGRFSLTEFSYLGLPDSFKSSFYFIDGNRKPYKGEKINWMKAAIIESDKVLTVSPNYASEIVSDAAKGVELDDVLRETGVIGIVNGMDVTEWDPKTDKYLLLNYDKTDAMVSKPIIKEALQAQVGLPVDRTIPLLGFVGRLEEQKGSDILVEAIPEFIGDNVQIVVLGSGKKNMEKQLSQLELKYPDKARGITRFDVPLAHLIVSGADFMLIPSRFEPCGLIQLQAMNNGTIPLATTTGGLPDTIKDGVTGFLVGGFNIDCDVVDPADVAAVAKTVKKAIGIYGTPAYSEMVQNCMSQDLSWMGPAKKWEEILLSLKNCCNKTRSDGEEEFPLVKENVAAP